MPTLAAVSLTLICSTTRIMKTTRTGAGSASIAVSTMRRICSCAAAASGLGGRAIVADPACSAGRLSATPAMSMDWRCCPRRRNASFTTMRDNQVARLD